MEVSGHPGEASDHSRAGKHEFRESQALERLREAAGSAYIGIKSSIPVIFYWNIYRSSSRFPGILESSRTITGPENINLENLWGSRD